MGFSRVLKVVLQNEGGYLTSDGAARVGDPGGATNYGITQATLDRLGIACDAADVSLSEAQDIYRAHYWQPVEQLEQVSDGLVLAVFDFGVQSGPARAIRALQRAALTATDGVVGPRTLDAASRCVLPAILGLSAARRRLLVTWSLAQPRRLALLRGVLARVDRVERRAVQWAVDERPTQPADVLWRGYGRIPRT